LLFAFAVFDVFVAIVAACIYFRLPGSLSAYIFPALTTLVMLIVSRLGKVLPLVYSESSVSLLLGKRSLEIEILRPIYTACRNLFLTLNFLFWLSLLITAIVLFQDRLRLMAGALFVGSIVIPLAMNVQERVWYGQDHNQHSAASLQP